jgi:hypothetical protein
MEAGMTQQPPQDDQQTPQDTAPRSENLLPRDDASTDDDGRFEVAEEVNLDQQSDTLHHVGNLPEDSDAAALAATLKKD